MQQSSFMQNVFQNHSGSIGETNSRPSARNGWIPLNRWLDEMDLSSVTAWRYRRKGWLEVVRIGGRLYITPQALAEFQRRAAAGHFEVQPTSENQDAI
jgi:hypothetical protein